MKIFVKAKPGSRKEGVEVIDKNHLIVRVKERPTKGRANKAVIEALAQHLKVAPSRISLVSGHTSRKKVFKAL